MLGRKKGQSTMEYAIVVAAIIAVVVVAAGGPIKDAVKTAMDKAAGKIATSFDSEKK